MCLRKSPIGPSMGMNATGVTFRQARGNPNEERTGSVHYSTPSSSRARVCGHKADCTAQLCFSSEGKLRESQEKWGTERRGHLRGRGSRILEIHIFQKVEQIYVPYPDHWIWESTQNIEHITLFGSSHGSLTGWSFDVSRLPSIIRTKNLQNVWAHKQ